MAKKISQAEGEHRRLLSSNRVTDRNGAQKKIGRNQGKRNNSYLLRTLIKY